MCRAKTEGGRRCLGHIRKQKASLESQLAYWEMELDYRTKRVEGAPNAENRNRVARVENRITSIRNKIDAVMLEETEAEIRKEREAEARANAPVGQKKDKELGAYLKPGEWAELEAQARDYGLTLSALVRKRLNEPPYIADVRSGVRTRVERKGHHAPFRDATEGVNDNGEYHRGKRRIRVTEATNQRLTEEADLFGLTRSDYARCLLLDIDPRTFGHHLGDDTVEAQTRAFFQAEEAEGVDDESVKGFWLGKVGDVRQKYIYA